LKLKEREHRCPKNGHHGGFALKKNTQPPQTFGTQPAGAPNTAIVWGCFR
jgi:hypothetical protein